MMTRTLKTFLRIVLITCKTASIKSCINREDKIKISQVSYTVMVVTKIMKFLAVVTPSSICHG